ncbi:FAD-binding oxidoreductase [Streptomyces sp. N2-109]|uniref:FAD-binding oxidoreductase n=1 Tax=Streptomyces gossypii TaxID=2883101 RepID=A0ABT2K0Q6_9ACTN|nr:FAD-binding oxidoreductase [Streptomyces gossypii]MCT2593752.1 FAD-binding oxidoreductase [Streptomyces gossypii]
MLILLDHALPADALSLVRGSEVCYRPALARRRREGRGGRGDVLARRRPDALLTRSVPDTAEAAAWRGAAGREAPLVVVVIPSGSEGGQARPVPDPAAGPQLIVRRLRERSLAGREPPAALYARALALAERSWVTAVTAPELSARITSGRHRRGSVALVGAGVVNLVTGLRLLRAGHEVSVYDSAPDPRSGAHWMAYGASRGGGDGRMFTLTETDGYHGNALSGPVPFLREPKDNGWCLAVPSALREEERAWVRDNARIPPWLARSYTEDVLLFNQVAKESWDGLARSEAALFHDVGLRHGILRLYTDPGKLRAHFARQRHLSAARAVFSPAEVAERYPALGGACASGLLAGGFEVTGFTVQIHRFLARLIGLLEDGGAAFHWGQPVEALRGGPGAPLEGLCRAGVPVHADNYVLSPGVYGGDLLRGTATDGLVHGVVGTWLTLPNVRPALRNSLKISRTGHLTEDANVTVTAGPGGESTLVVGSGYGWTGADPTHIDPARLDVLHLAVEDTAATFFPEAFEEARRTDLLRRSRRHCVRPWTASSLPVLEVAPNAHGGLVVVTGGHNTGGFAQAPVVAQAVAAALHGEAHPMHTRYHPDRLRVFYRQR